MPDGLEGLFYHSNLFWPGQVFALSLRLRQREIDTVFKLGCRRMTIARLMAAEIVIIIVFSSFLCVGFMTIVEYFKHDLVRMAFI